MAQNNVYNEIPGNSEEKLAISGATSAQSHTQITSNNDVNNIVPPSSNAAGGTNVVQKGKKNVKEINFRNLEGDLDILPTPKNFRIMAGMTVNIQGVGKFLSGFYYVMNRSVSISGNNAMSITISVIKTNFGDSLKGEPPIVIETEDLIGDKEQQQGSSNRDAYDTQGNYSYDGYKGGDSQPIASNSSNSGGGRVYHGTRG